MFTLIVKSIYSKHCNILKIAVYLKGNKSNNFYYLTSNKSINK